MINLQKKRGFFGRIGQASSVGINISDYSLKLIKLDKRRGKNFLKGFEIIPLDRSVLKNGRIQNHEKFKEALLEIRKNHRLNFINVSFPAEQAKFLKINLPPIENKKVFLDSLDFGIKERLSWPKEEFLFTYEKIPLALERGYDEILVSVFPKKVLLEYSEAFKKARMNPVYFEHEGKSLERTLSQEVGNIMVIDYGKSRTIFSFFKNGKMHYCEPFKVSGKSSLLDEVNQRIIKKEFPENVEKIIITGDASGTKGLPEYLSNRLNLNVERGDVWQNVSFKQKELPSVHYRDSFSYTSALGSALL